MRGSQTALENAVDKLFEDLSEIEFEYELDRSEWVEQIRSWIGNMVANGYQEWISEHDD